MPYPCRVRALQGTASEATTIHGSMATSNLRTLGAAPNLGGGAREIRQDRDAEGAHLRRVLRATTRRHQEAAPTKLPRGLDVAQAIAHPAAPGEVEAEGSLSLPE